MPTTFREALQVDADRVAEIYLSSRKELVSFAPLAHSDDDVSSWIADTLIPGSRVIVAENEGRLIGMMALSEAQNFGWIDHLYLDPAQINRGIGTKFVVRAKSELRHPIRLYTFHENLASRRFYERHGFCAIEFTDGTDNEEHCPDVLYEFAGPTNNTGEQVVDPDAAICSGSVPY
jgi:RimJ/RimL family protein N-acetyltransferase